MGQTGPPSPPVRSPGRPPSRPRPADSRPRSAIDVSPFRDLDQPCVGTPSEGLDAPFPPRPVPLHPSPFVSHFPTGSPTYRLVVPPYIHRVSLDSTGTRPFKEVFTFSSDRGAMCPCVSYEVAPSTTSPPTQTRVQPPHMVETLRFGRSLEETPLQGICPSSRDSCGAGTAHGDGCGHRPLDSLLSI